MEPELLDQGKQTKRVHMPDGIGPQKFSSIIPIEVNGKGVVEMRNSGDIPRVTGLGACAETASVISKIGDDDFDDLQGKPGGRRTVRCRGLQGNTP